MAQAKATPLAQSRLQDIFSSRYAVFYVLVLPAFLLRMIYTVIPIIQTVLISFTNRTILGGQYIGLRNYEMLTKDATLIGSLGWTLLYTGTAAVAETIIGLGIAFLLMQNLRLRWLSNFIMLLPWVVAPMLAAIAFRILYFEDGGILNEISAAAWLWQRRRALAERCRNGALLHSCDDGVEERLLGRADLHGGDRLIVQRGAGSGRR